MHRAAKHPTYRRRGRAGQGAYVPHARVAGKRLHAPATRRRPPGTHPSTIEPPHPYRGSAEHRPRRRRPRAGQGGRRHSPLSRARRSRSSGRPVGRTRSAFSTGSVAGEAVPPSLFGDFAPLARGCSFGRGESRARVPPPSSAPRTNRFVILNHVRFRRGCDYRPGHVGDGRRTRSPAGSGMRVAVLCHRRATPPRGRQARAAMRGRRGGEGASNGEHGSLWQPRAGLPETRLRRNTAA